jgi:hypothetical protein
MCELAYILIMYIHIVSYLDLLYLLLDVSTQFATQFCKLLTSLLRITTQIIAKVSMIMRKLTYHSRTYKLVKHSLHLLSTFQFLKEGLVFSKLLHTK